MDLEYKLSMLESKDTSKAYKSLQELEEISEDSDILYPYLDKFIEMTLSDKNVMRVRGFRLFCMQAKWDEKDIIDESLDSVLNILYDEKPTTVRQALAALTYLVPYKKDLHELIKDKVNEIDPYKYKNTMHVLLEKDIEALLMAMDKVDNK